MPDRNAIGALVLAAILMAIGAATASRASDYPDWESQWRNPTAGRGGNPWDTTKPMGRAQQAPLTPEYQAIFEASLRDQAKGGQGNSLGASCVLPGMPKVMNFSDPMEIIIRPRVTYFVPLHYPTRRIYTDGRDWPADEPPSFGGYSIGRWIDQGGAGGFELLEVETRNFKGPRVFESTGLPLHRPSSRSVSISTGPTRTSCTTRSPPSTMRSPAPGRSTGPMCANPTRPGSKRAATKPTATSSSAPTNISSAPTAS